MKILVVVDVQNDFISGKLGSYSAQCKVPVIREKIQGLSTDKERVIIVFTKDSHNISTYTPENTVEASLIPLHCEPFTEGSQIESSIIETARNKVGMDSFYIRTKDRPGCMKWAETIEDIEEYYEESISEIEIVGFCTDICVITNFILLRTLLPATRIVIDASCCAGTTPEAHYFALQIIKSCMGEVINEH